MRLYAGEPRPRDFVATRYNEDSGDFSPDGRWVAYATDESGRTEIYVASFAEAGRRYRVSSGGGANPRWSHDGRELFYLVGGKIMTAVAVRSEGRDLAFGAPQPLFEARVGILVETLFRASRYDVAADGRFLIAVRASDELPTPLVLVLNWAEQLKPRPRPPLRTTLSARRGKAAAPGAPGSCRSWGAARRCRSRRTRRRD